MDFYSSALHSSPKPFFHKRIRTLLLVISYILSPLLPMHAQQFAAQCMTSPMASDSACLWFRRTFVGEGRPHRAAIYVETDSRFVLYVNGRNASTSQFMPCRPWGDAHPMSITIDVSRFTRPDTNTVALLACPTPHPAPRHFAPPRVIIDFHGTTPDDKPFAYGDADGWMCRQASTCMTTDGELMDGTLDDMPPHYGDMAMPQWMPADTATMPSDIQTGHQGVSGESLFGHRHDGCNPLTDSGMYAWRTLRPRDVDADAHSMAYDFGPGFHGLVRVTLRGCHRGERLRIGNLQYICSGEIDEQAICRFTPCYMRKIYVSGDSFFDPSQVQEVEAVCF